MKERAEAIKTNQINDSKIQISVVKEESYDSNIKNSFQSGKKYTKYIETHRIPYTKEVKLELNRSIEQKNTNTKVYKTHIYNNDKIFDISQISCDELLKRKNSHISLENKIPNSNSDAAKNDKNKYEAISNIALNKTNQELVAANREVFYLIIISILKVVFNLIHFHSYENNLLIN